jgi:hypothetical protein
MAWIAAATGGLKRMVYAPPTWIAVWVGGTIAGVLADSERLAVGCFLVGSPALLLTLIADIRRHEARPEPAAEPIDAATRYRMKKARRYRESFTRDSDPTGHTLH